MKHELCILILQRGWVVVGNFLKGPEWCELLNASVIRRWGTIKGLGEIALEGPRSDTILDKCGDMDIPHRAIIAVQKCNSEVWDGKLP
jgi:hypothetical protein